MFFQVSSECTQEQYFDNLSGVPAEDLPYYGGSVEIADYCPFSQEFSWHLSGEFQRSSDCRIIENQPVQYILSTLDPTKNYGAEEYGPNSVCLIQKSAFVMEQCRRKLSYPDWGSGCYQVSCSPQGLHVWVKDTAYLCSRSGQVLTVSIQMNGWVHIGNLICPACSDFCDSCPPEKDPPALNLSRAAAVGRLSCSCAEVKLDLKHLKVRIGNGKGELWPCCARIKDVKGRWQGAGQSYFCFWDGNSG
ncbi:UNVERIFIED_CONTAM: hypothetical protein H355_007436 [Colinus virginianus]|nr:hypothetical protein H355_007436 [Colinus virginianus]